MEWSVLWRACNLTAFIHSSTGPVVHPFASRHKGSIPRGVLTVCGTGNLLLALSHYIGDPDVIDHCGLVWGGLRPKLSLSCPKLSYRQCDNPTWSHTTLLSRFHARCGSSLRLHNHIVGCWGGALSRACNLTALIHSSTGPVVHPFASRHEGPGFNPQGGTYLEPGISC